MHDNGGETGSIVMGLRLSLLLVLAIVSPAAAQTSGYSGQQEREIKALSAEETADLLAGRGMGAARAAELNHFPGPAHVLEMQAQLELSARQIRAVQDSFDRMSAAARPLGIEIVAAERRLDEAFASGAIDPETLRAETVAIGELQGRLRAVHLTAHLETRDQLSPEQIARYDALRGYGGDVPPAGHDHHPHKG
jgi:Heavy-metal resistance